MLGALIQRRLERQRIHRQRPGAAALFDVQAGAVPAQARRGITGLAGQPELHPGLAAQAKGPVQRLPKPAHAPEVRQARIDKHVADPRAGAQRVADPLGIHGQFDTLTAQRGL